MTTIEERVLALVEAAYREGWDDGCSYINTEDNGWAENIPTHAVRVGEVDCYKEAYCAGAARAAQVMG